MNSRLEHLHSYPFEKLRDLLDGLESEAEQPALSLGIGEPKFPPPTFIADALATNLSGLCKYPVTKGLLMLRQAIADWVIRRYQLPALSVNPEKHILPVNGTREALFAIAQAIVDSGKSPLVLMTNPFYQIYEGAAILSGAEPYYLNTTEQTEYLPDFDAVPAEVWRRCQLIYICSPNNPTGSILQYWHLAKLLQLADQYDFVIASDECYSEIYQDENNPPMGLLQVAHQMGNTEFNHCIAFNSLSKRSSVPGLRSGFVAGNETIIQQFYRYRTYHGCAMPLPIQHASIAAWQDEQHVIDNRAKYRQTICDVYNILNPVLSVEEPDGGFFLWPQTLIDDTEFAQKLFVDQNITVLPGQYLSRPFQGVDPGLNRIRIALVHSHIECLAGAHSIQDFITNS
ncbi:MAG: succinyldiaminopimelate transaminase [Gammaproteobacteria bacterium]|nr:succinyldiaminopimelate transaminase [Gammaproteobacteria bacterium]